MNEKAKLNLVSAAAAETANIQLQKELIAALAALEDLAGRRCIGLQEPAMVAARAVLAKAGA